MMEPVTVSASRLPAATTSNPFSLTQLDSATLEQSPNTRLDDLLRNEIPSFSLFRRNSSRVAHPTTQGVSLRNLGPNGAGRTLVLLDGVPLNDPFAGWVPWQRVPTASLEKIFVTRGGGAGLYGNAALAGTIQLESKTREPTSLEISGLAGNHDTYEQSLRGAWEGESTNFSFFTQHSETGGYPVVRSDLRGPIDQSADSKFDLFQGRFVWQQSPETRFEFSAAAFQEERGNGTPGAYNSTDGWDFSAAVIHSIPELDAEAKLQGYYQRREFASTFTAVNEARTQETPALDQFSVPANSAGASLTWSQRIAANHQLVAGADFRWIEGETNERFRFMEGRFTRDRRAGGEQWFAGLFVEDTWQLAPGIELIAGGRLDSIQQTNGSRTERDRQNGRELLQENYADSDNLEPNGRLGLSAQMSEALRFRTAAFTGFRQPTLNEFYRPFRVGNEITEANAELQAERLFGLEAGVDWTSAEEWELSLTGFYNQLRDAVGNVTLGEGPGTFEPGGFVPAGGVLRQRQNLDEVEVAGLEASLRWKPSKEWTLGAAYLYSHATVEKAPNAPGLEGKRLEQAPSHVATASVAWHPSDKWTFILQTRFTGSQYEDDLNTLKLSSSTTVDLGVNYQLTKRLRLDLNIENLFDTTIETGKRDDGLVSIGAPFLISLGARYQF